MVQKWFKLNDDTCFHIQPSYALVLQCFKLSFLEYY